AAVWYCEAERGWKRARRRPCSAVVSLALRECARSAVPGKAAPAAIDFEARGGTRYLGLLQSQKRRRLGFDRRAFGADCTADGRIVVAPQGGHDDQADRTGHAALVRC